MLAIVATSCRGGEGDPAADGAASSRVVLPPTTKVLDDESLDAITSVDDQGTVTFAAATDLVTSLDIGDVVLAGVSEHTPGGLMRKVASIDGGDGEVVVRTSVAALDEAIETARIQHHDELKVTDVNLDHPDTQLAEGVELVDQPAGSGSDDDEGALLVPDPAGGSEPVALAIEPISHQQLAGGSVLALNDVVLHDGADGRVTASGSIAFSPTFDLVIEVSDFQLDQFTVELGFDEGVTLALDATGSASLDEDITVASLVPAVVTVPAPVPIVITPRLDFTVTAKGSVTADLHTSVVQTASASAGFGWRDGGFNSFGDSNSDFELDTPAFEGTATGRVALGGRVALCLWVVFCGYARADGFVSLDARTGQPAPCLDWDLTGGLDVAVGVDLPLLVAHVQEEASVIGTDAMLDRHRCGSDDGGGTDGGSGARAPWARTYSGDGGATAYAIETTRDGGAIVAADAAFSSSFGGGTALWLVKLDASGEIEWQRQYGGAGSARGVRQVRGGFLVAASNGEVLKVNGAGRLVWARRYSVADAGGGPVGVRLQALEATPTGGAVVAGSVTTSTTRDDAVVFEIDGSGDLEWAQRYGGDGGETAAGLARSTDGTVLLAASTLGTFSDEEAAWLLALGPGGRIIWQRTYAVDWLTTPGGVEPTTVNAAARTADGGFVVGGRIAGYQYDPYCDSIKIEEGACDGTRAESAAWVMRVDGGGEVVWSSAMGMGTLDDRITALAEVGTSIIGTGSLGVGDEQDVWGLQLRGGDGRLGWSRVFGGPRYDAPGPGLILRGGGQFVAAGGPGVRIVATSASFDDRNQVWLLNLTRTGQVTFADGSAAASRNRGGRYVPVGDRTGPEGDVLTSTAASATRTNAAAVALTSEKLTEQIEVVATR